ncbi:MAG: helix-turn-helix transcriptional regulator [Akkermansiaceae bacterium]|nr:helix-turn-helix transcriptional regulator [Akkermansiaceae bacterium]
MKVDVHWWKEGTGINYGRLTGKVSSGGWRWRGSSHGDVWLWLNHTGRGLIWGRGERFMLHPGMYALTGGGDLDEWTCVRYPGPHEMELVRLSRKWLAAHLGKQTEWLHPDLVHWLKEGGRLAFCGLMGVWEHDLCSALKDAATHGGGRELLAEARFLEWAAVRLYREKSGDPGGGFCSTYKGRDPVRKAIDIIRTRLDQPLDLSALANEIGIAPHYLSRRVSAETGLTLLRHLRRMRISRACEWLGSGRMNVTEAALEVGYQSLSHLRKPFVRKREKLLKTG